MQDLSPALRKHMKIFVRGAEIQAQAGTLAIEELEKQTAAQKERDKRKERQRKVTQSGGVLSVGEARSICEENLAAEERAERKRRWAADKRKAKKLKESGMGKVHAELRRAFKKRQRLAARNAEIQVESENDDEQDHEGEASSDEEEAQSQWEQSLGPLEGERCSDQ